jgi:hypothetical protein
VISNPLSAHLFKDEKRTFSLSSFSLLLCYSFSMSAKLMEGEGGGVETRKNEDRDGIYYL